MTSGQNCASSCRTRDHKTFGECRRAARLSAMWLGGTGPSYSEQRRFARDTDEYRKVVKAGGSISTAMNKGVEAAYKEAAERSPA